MREVQKVESLALGNRLDLGVEVEGQYKNEFRAAFTLKTGRWGVNGGKRFRKETFLILDVVTSQLGVASLACGI